MMIRGTTILAVKHRGKVTVAGDGQVTLDTTVSVSRLMEIYDRSHPRAGGGKA